MDDLLEASTDLLRASTELERQLCQLVESRTGTNQVWRSDDDHRLAQAFNAYGQAISDRTAERILAELLDE